MPRMSGTLAIDVGGTFTDVTFADAVTGASWVAKTPSTPSDLSAGFIAAVRKVLTLANRGPADVVRVLHGTTTATNAILEGKTPPTALITTAGFKYVLEIGRHDIPRHGNLYGWSKPARPISADRVFEVSERLDAEGGVLTALDEMQARAVARQLAQLGLPPLRSCSSTRTRTRRTSSACTRSSARRFLACSSRSRPRCSRSSASSSARWPPR